MKRTTPEPPLDKLKLFALCFIKADCNGARAAKMAGHKGTTQTLSVTANRLLKNEKVRSHLRLVRAEMVMDAIETLQRHSDIARGSMDDFLTNGKIDLGKAKRRGVLHLLKEVTEKERIDSDGARIVQRKIALYPKDSAQRVLLQYHGLLDRPTRDAPKDEQDLHEELAQNILRVHGKEKGVEIVKALGLKVTQAIH